MRRIGCLAGAALLLAAKLWAGATGDLSATMATAGDDAWGVVALLQLYAGLIALGGLVWHWEPDRRIAVAVLVLMPAIGSAAPALWLALRGGSLAADAFTPAPAAETVRPPAR
jgi:hypothetical protein